MNNTLRYVHASNFLDGTKCPYTGFTICYYREDDYVKFSYALCFKEDQYEKIIGRQRSAVNIHALHNFESGDKTAFDKKLRSGIIDVSYFKNAVNNFGMFSDQMVNDLTMMDFKHSAISKILVEFVYGLGIVYKYPNSKL